MRSRNFIIITVVLVFILNAGVLLCYSQESGDKDNFGKAVGLIVDADTGEPVNEAFVIRFIDISVKSMLASDGYGTTTDSNGKFTFEWKPGEYFLYCYPKEYKSDYTWGPDPFNYPETFQKAIIERGKITRIVKKAYPAGKIKMIYMTPDGMPFDFKNQSRRIIPSVEIQSDFPGNSSLSRQVHYSIEKNSKDPEKRYRNKLYPGVYRLFVEFPGLGYGSKMISNVVVEKNIVTEVEVSVDLNDNTGVEGIVTDKKNFPLKDIFVKVEKSTSDFKHYYNGGTRTNENGFYKIVGLKEGLYKIKFVTTDPNDVFNTQVSSKKVYIEGNRIKILNHIQ